VSFSVAARLG